MEIGRESVLLCKGDMGSVLLCNGDREIGEVFYYVMEIGRESVLLCKGDREIERECYSM
jgi:hypothetical protein